ncbi:hypothetical protein C8A01DRAFT_19168 [Parachaetomium inaequale]|uniref:Prolyl 4-hydroxylase alpha subunit domain-containing protein n=1 Tax=Parachaetomium inaequale TaxID=2588326 RepID=A0AAN6SNL8_9PEZI|nr:hypothetical protein C8A01DRAFT_19168 [Parachaetomium inaequale]
MFAKLKAALTPTPPPLKLNKNPPIKTNYTSLPVPLPPTFLTSLPSDARPITTTPINWAKTPLPEYAGLYAVVLDHVLSPSECATLLALAEASPWGLALVNVGGGFEVLQEGYRNGERIVWDCQEVVDRIWERCLQGGEGLRERFGVVGADERDIVGFAGREGMRGGRWEFLRVNERMRFLRYGKGGFFKPHCDAAFADTRDPARTIRTMFTIHLYLNDSKAEVEGAELVGGATSFYSNDEKRKIDVNPKAGRVLIFQHRRLLHSGDDVRAGTKYTMRTDIMYEFRYAEKEEEEQS